jgi:hypothetical protein
MSARKITDELVERICVDVEQHGENLKSACAIHGVNYASLRSLRETNEWVGLRVKRALATVERNIIAEGDEAARNGKSTAWWQWRAERLAGGHYLPPAVRTKNEHSGPGGKPQEHRIEGALHVSLEDLKRIARKKGEQ